MHNRGGGETKKGEKKESLNRGRLKRKRQRET